MTIRNEYKQLKKEMTSFFPRWPNATAIPSLAL